MVYIIITVTAGIPSSGLLQYLIPTCTTPFYYASSGNQWADLLWGYIPQWMAVSDREAVNWFWEGRPAGALIPWGKWAYVLSHWAILVGGLWLMMLCLASLVRKQWGDRERLTFPLVQFPLEVLRGDEPGGQSFFGNKLVWIGAGCVLLVHLVNGLQQYFPAIPNIPTFWELDNYLVDRPWNAAQPLYVGVFFGAVGFGYLLSLEVTAGFWVSVLFIKAQAILFSLLGMEGSSAYSGVIGEIGQREQMGGLLAVFAVLMWLLRGTFSDALRKAFTRVSGIDDSGEPMGYRLAALGFLVGLLVAECWLTAAGMTPVMAFLWLATFIAIILVLTRIIAEAGMLMVHLSFSPVDYLAMLGGTGVLGPANLTVLTFIDHALAFDLREFMMPAALNGFRLAEQAGVPTRRMTPIMGIALVVVLGTTIPAFLYTFYGPGAANVTNAVELSYHSRRFFGQLGNWLQSPSNPTAVQYLSTLAGGAIVAALSWLRLNFVWWPVHPLGFVMATSWASLNLWFSLFLGWFLKLLTIRYTGLRGYVQFRPLFLGIVLGDVMGGVLWIIVGFFTKVGIMVTVR